MPFQGSKQQTRTGSANAAARFLTDEDRAAGSAENKSAPPASSGGGYVDWKKLREDDPVYVPIDQTKTKKTKTYDDYVREINAVFTPKQWEDMNSQLGVDYDKYDQTIDFDALYALLNKRKLAMDEEARVANIQRAPSPNELAEMGSASESGKSSAPNGTSTQETGSGGVTPDLVPGYSYFNVDNLLTAYEQRSLNDLSKKEMDGSLLPHERDMLNRLRIKIANALIPGQPYTPPQKEQSGPTLSKMPESMLPVDLGQYLGDLFAGIDASSPKRSDLEAFIAQERARLGKQGQDSDTLKYGAALDQVERLMNQSDAKYDQYLNDSLEYTTLRRAEYFGSITPEERERLNFLEKNLPAYYKLEFEYSDYMGAWGPLHISSGMAQSPAQRKMELEFGNDDDIWARSSLYEPMGFTKSTRERKQEWETDQLDQDFERAKKNIRPDDPEAQQKLADLEQNYARQKQGIQKKYSLDTLAIPTREELDAYLKYWNGLTPEQQAADAAMINVTLAGNQFNLDMGKGIMGALLGADSLENQYTDGQKRYLMMLYARSGGKGYTSPTPLDQATQMIAGAVPSMLLALFSGGTSTLPTTESLMQYGPKMFTFQSKTETALIKLFESPPAQVNFVVGYNQGTAQAIRDGADDATANLVGLTNALFGAMIETSGGFGGSEPQLQKGFGAFISEVLVHEGGENVAQDILWEAITALAYDPEKPIFSLTDENAILNPLRAGKQFAGGALVAGGLGVGAYAATAKIRGFVVSAYADGYVSKQTAADLLDEIDAAFPGAAKLMEDAHLTGAGPQLEVPEGLDINDPLAQAAKNDIMKAQGIQDGNGNGIDAPGDPVHQLAENAGEKIKFSQMTTDEAMKVAQKYRLKAPIEIPENATIKPVSKAGYEQISFGWRDETYIYGVRWHTRTPGAPVDQGNTWVIERIIPGSGGNLPKSEILSGSQWITKSEWQEAIKAYQKGTATQQQLQILEQGHWKEQEHDR